MKVKFYTLGCKVNQYETEALKNDFLSNGFEVTAGKADLYVINTCSITAKADSDSRSILVKTRRENPEAKIAVCGCWANSNTEKINKLGADYCVEQNKKTSLIDLVKAQADKNRNVWSFGISEFSNQRAFLKIQDGCDNFCSFCKVPFLRGRSTSRKPDDVLTEAHKLSLKHKEIVLCGINLGLYGKDLKQSTGLAELAGKLLENESITRLRLSSLEPYSVNDKIIALIQHPKMCPHVHFPFQSADNNILKAMRKKETVELYGKIVNKLYSLNPDIAISCDIIVGFPGEENKNFENTLSFLDKVRPMRIHIFTFSPRENTSLYGQKIDHKIAKKRYKIIKERADLYSLEYRKRFLGKTLKVIAEETKQGFASGYSENYIKVKFSVNTNQGCGQIETVRIEKVTNKETLGTSIK